MHKNKISLKSLERPIYGARIAKVSFLIIPMHNICDNELSCDFFPKRSLFKQIKDETENICEKLFLLILKFYSANLSTLFKFKNSYQNLVRVGPAFYGYIKTNIIFNSAKVKLI